MPNALAYVLQPVFMLKLCAGSCSGKLVKYVAYRRWCLKASGMLLKYTVPAKRLKSTLADSSCVSACKRSFSLISHGVILSFFENGLVRPRLVSVATSSLLVNLAPPMRGRF